MQTLVFTQLINLRKTDPQIVRNKTAICYCMLGKFAFITGGLKPQADMVLEGERVSITCTKCDLLAVKSEHDKCT